MNNIILDIWYPEGDRYQKWWFLGNHDSISIKIIRNSMSKINKPHHYWKKNKETCLEGILYYDQFHRHTQTNTVETDKIAVELCLYGIQQNWIPEEPHYLVFFLMPLRHTKNINFIEYCIRYVNKRMKQIKQPSSHYKRFLNASYHSIRSQPLTTNLLEIDTWLDWVDQHRDILCDESEYQHETNKEWIYKSNAWKSFQSFMKDHQYNSIVISLSGGVDSMVFLYLCFLYEKNNKDFNFYAVHMNWNQREESTREAEFLIQYLIRMGVPYIYKNIHHMDRTENREKFEEEGKEIRFNLYKEALYKWNADCVFLGHHNGDIIENVFTNMLHGKHVMDMGKMKIISTINKVPIIRPFLTIDKEDIYEVAKKELIPFFKNTTPLWSNRGFIRTNVFPQLDKQFGQTYKVGLNTIAKKTREIGDMVEKCLVQPYLNKIEYLYKDTIEIKMPLEEYPMIFYEIVFEKLLYKMNMKKCSHKSLEGWYHHVFKNKKSNTYTLTKNISITTDKNQFIIMKLNS